MRQEECTALVAGCIHDASAPCSAACPFGLDVRSFLHKAAKGRWSAAYRELRTALVFPTVAAALCERPCRGACQRRLIGDEPLDLGRLEEAVIRLSDAQAPNKFPVPPKEEKIAVIGAGPAGLSIALNMAQKKYPVTVFERGDRWGGSLNGHPQFDVFDADFTLQYSAEQVEFRYGTKVSSLDELSDFAAVCIATGDGGEHFGLLDGWDSALMSTAAPGVFLVGGVVGMGLMESIAAGSVLSKVVESAIQTGRPSLDAPKATCGGHSLAPKDAVSAAHVLPADGDAGYTKEEAKAEAARCFQCNCSHCLTQCELLAQYKKPPLQMAMEVLADSSPRFLASRTMTRESYSCNLCSWCSDTCPEGVDMGELFRRSREERAAAGIQPAAFHDFWLRELDFASHDGFFASAPMEKNSCEYAFFPGCQLTASLPEHTLKTMELLARQYGAGVILGCCGAPAWWAGERPLWEENVKRLRAAWESLGKPTLVLACASCMEVFARLMPDVPTVSLYELLAQQEDLNLSQPFSACAVFDPCNSRRDDGMRRGVRALAKQSGMDCAELSGPPRCCGYGGHMKTANPELYKTVVHNRAGESELPYLVYCANCRESFLSEGKQCAHVLEALFGPAGTVPHLAQKRRNTLKVKGELMRAMQNETFIPPAKPWDGVELHIPDGVRAEMEEHLVTDDDVKECIFAAEESGECFIREDGGKLATLIRDVITYWVEYRAASKQAYEVESVYSHRMRFGEGGGEHV